SSHSHAASPNANFGTGTLARVPAITRPTLGSGMTGDAGLDGVRAGTPATSRAVPSAVSRNGHDCLTGLRDKSWHHRAWRPRPPPGICCAVANSGRSATEVMYRATEMVYNETINACGFLRRRDLRRKIDCLSPFSQRRAPKALAARNP